MPWLVAKPSLIEINGWKLDLKMVYRWNWRQRARFRLREWLAESPDGSYAVLFYGIGEIGLNQQIAKIAVFRNKVCPKLILRPRWTTFWFEGLVDIPVRFDTTTQRAHVYQYVNSVWSKEATARERVIDFPSECILPA